MAKRGRKPKTGLATLVAQLERLDEQRRALIAGIRAAADALVTGNDSGGAGVGNGQKAKGGRRKGSLSAEARAKIGAAQKKRWAAQRKKDS